MASRRFWPSNHRTVQVVAPGPDPLATQFAAALQVATSLVSPMTRGRFLPGLSGVGARRDTRDPGALQDLRGQALVTRKMDRIRGGIGGGPGDPSGLPSTGSRGSSPVMSALAGMSLPEVLR